MIEAETAKATRIVLLPSSYYPGVGGVQEICRNLATILKDRQYEVAIVVHKHPDDLPSVEYIDGIEVRRFDFFYPNRSPFGVFSSVRTVSGLISFASWLVKWKPNLIHVICPSTSSLFLWATKKLGSWKILVTLQGELFMDADQVYQRSALVRWTLSKLLSVCDGVTACSQYVLDDARSKFEMEHCKQSIVFNGVDLQEPISTADLVPLPEKFILGIGRLVENKGFDDLITAFGKIAAAYPDVDLVIAGGGNAEQQLRQLTKRLNLSERVKFIDWQKRSAVGALFKACQFLVMPSPVEPFGIVCLEAMRAGKAVIATNTGGPPEFLHSGEDSILVPPCDPEALVNAMKQLLVDPDLSESMGATGSARIGNFAWPTLACQYEEIYEQLGVAITKSECAVAAASPVRLEV